MRIEILDSIRTSIAEQRIVTIEVDDTSELQQLLDIAEDHRIVTAIEHPAVIYGVRGKRSGYKWRLLVVTGLQA